MLHCFSIDQNAEQLLNWYKNKLGYFHFKNENDTIEVPSMALNDFYRFYNETDFYKPISINSKVKSRVDTASNFVNQIKHYYNSLSCVDFNNKTYYINKGIIINNQNKILLLCCVKFKKKEDIWLPVKNTLYLDKKVLLSEFDKDLCKYIKGFFLKKFITTTDNSYYTHYCLRRSNQKYEYFKLETDIVYTDLDNIIQVPETPTIIDNKSINDLLYKGLQDNLILDNG